MRASWMKRSLGIGLLLGGLVMASAPIRTIAEAMTRSEPSLEARGWPRNLRPAP